MAIAGASLVGGEVALEQRMKQWGYTDQTDTVQKAVELYQQTFRPSLDYASQRFNGRPIIPDGEIGQATALEINTRTCGAPDFFDGPEEAAWPDS